MILYYDTISEMYSLKKPDGVVFLGPFTHTMLTLQEEYDLTVAQARDAVLRAMMSNGAGIDLAIVERKVASLYTFVPA